MKFFFPDAQDLVDPSFDFVTERRSVTRVRQRDDAYAHELFSTPPYDGLLLSKGIVDGIGAGAAKYTLAQRHRLYRVGVREFLRLNTPACAHLKVIGDCGAFTYVREKTPPYKVDQVLEFYVSCRFDYGISVDHVILEYNPGWDVPGATPPAAVVERQEITLEMASEFFKSTRSLDLKPLGVAQGWSPASYAHSVKSLQKMGYDYIALGGMVPLKTTDILRSLEGIASVRKPKTQLHLLGITRIEHINDFGRYGVASFDSTSPLRQAFKDDRDNYFTPTRTYTAVRIPQVQGNPALQKRIRAGIVPHDKARALEKRCLQLMARFDKDPSALAELLDSLQDYEELYDPGSERRATNEESLRAKSWDACGCDICVKLKYHVILFRGAERNRRRGFHNLWVFYRRVKQLIGHSDVQPQARREPSPRTATVAKKKRVATGTGG